MKAAGSLLIIVSGILLGQSFSNDYRREIENIRAVEGLMEFLDREIEYARTPLPEACLKTADRVEKPYSEILRQIYYGMNQQMGKSFEEVWKAEFSQGLSKTALKENEKRKLIEFGKINSLADCEMQTSCLKRNAEEFGEIRKRKEEVMMKRSRAVVSLCTVGGIMLTIMLL